MDNLEDCSLKIRHMILSPKMEEVSPIISIGMFDMVRLQICCVG